MLNLDFSSVPKREPLPAGDYVLVIEAAEQGRSSTNKDMLKIRWKEQQSGVAIFENYILEPNCLWKLQQLFDALGLPTESLVQIDPTELVGQMVKAKVTQEPYEDTMQNRIKKVSAC